MTTLHDPHNTDRMFPKAQLHNSNQDGWMQRLVANGPRSRRQKVWSPKFDLMVSFPLHGPWTMQVSQPADIWPAVSPGVPCMGSNWTFLFDQQEMDCCTANDNIHLSDLDRFKLLQLNTLWPLNNSFDQHSDFVYVEDHLAIGRNALLNKLICSWRRTVCPGGRDYVLVFLVYFYYSNSSTPPPSGPETQTHQVKELQKRLRRFGKSWLRLPSESFFCY